MATAAHVVAVAAFASMQLAIPDIPVLPLFSDIPYKITITTTSAPLAREKAHADKDKGKGTTSTFPPLPRDPHELEFELEQRLQLRADIFKGREGKASHTVATILGGKKDKEKGKGAPTKIDIELPEREWVPLGAALVSDGKEKEKAGEDGAGAGKGSWVQRATFRSTFRLSCPPAFAVQNIDCNVRLPVLAQVGVLRLSDPRIQYVLVVKVPFPGIGNSLKLEVPVTITSGIDKPLAQKNPADADSEPSVLDLPPCGALFEPPSPSRACLLDSLYSVFRLQWILGSREQRLGQR